MKADDNELVAAAAGGDAVAFQVLLERHYDTIYRIAFRFAGMREDAEDITQEVCTSLSGKLRSFKGDARFTTWLYRVVVNAVRDMQRKQASTRRLHEAYGEIAELKRDEAADAARENVWLYDSLDQVSDDLRATAVLVLAEGFSHAEAADILEIKESTVSWRMHELKKKLKVIAEEQA